MAKQKVNLFRELAAELEKLPPEVGKILSHGALLRQTKVKSLRRSLSAGGFDVTDLDVELDVLRGTKATVGLLHALGVEEDDKPKEKPADPAQKDIEDELDRDFRTHERNTSQVRELVSSIASDEKPVKAVQILNRLEDGEREREGGARESVLKVIRDARAPLVKKVESLRVVD